MNELTKPQFERADVIRATGLPTTTLTTWLARGIVVPASGASPGYGRPHSFSVINAIEIGIMAEATAFGIAISEAKKIVVFASQALATELAAGGDFGLLVSRANRAPGPVDSPLVRAAEKIAQGMTATVDEDVSAGNEYAIIRGGVPTAGSGPVLFLPLAAMARRIMRSLEAK